MLRNFISEIRLSFWNDMTGDPLVLKILEAAWSSP